MTQPYVYEGTAQELVPLLAQYPNRRFRLIDLTTQDEKPAQKAEPGENVKTAPVIDAKNAEAIAMLEAWMKEEATDDPDEIRRAEEEYAEFKRNMNANREATGERLVYP